MTNNMNKFTVIRKWAKAKGYEVQESTYFTSIIVVTPIGKYEFSMQESTVFRSHRGKIEGNAKGLYMAFHSNDSHRFGYSFQISSQKWAIIEMEYKIAQWEKEMASKEETIEEVAVAVETIEYSLPTQNGYEIIEEVVAVEEVGTLKIDGEFLNFTFKNGEIGAGIKGNLYNIYTAVFEGVLYTKDGAHWKRNKGGQVKEAFFIWLGEASQKLYETFYKKDEVTIAEPIAEYYQGEIIQDRKGMWNGEVRRSKDNFTVAIVSKPSKQACKNAIANEILRLETENVEKLKLWDLKKHDWQEAVVVITKESFGEIEYDLIDRSYKIFSNANYFDSSKISSSLFGNCLDGKDLQVRLDWYIHDSWKIDYCYIIK